MLKVFGLGNMLLLIKVYKWCLAFLLLLANGLVIAQTSTSTMSEAAKASQKMQNPLYPQIQLPFTYNYNQKLGANNGTQQSEIGFGPIIPVSLTDDVQLILNPFLTYNHNANGQQVTNQNQPIQLATFIAPAFFNEWFYGIGPYVQAPATNANNGSKQTGVGLSAGAYYAPPNWVMGVSAYNSWGIGNNLSGGTANVINAQPTITYITDNAWAYNLSSQIAYNYDARAATNQLTLSGGKTIKMWSYHMQWQIGPTYMITATPTSAKGIGAFAGLTFLLPK